MQRALFSSPNQINRLTRWPPSCSFAEGWSEVVDIFLNSAAGQSLANAIEVRIHSGALIYPPTPFKALQLTPLSQVRVVILGQDPYHGLGQAQGLAFSVATGVKVPPSLRNIFKELGRETGDVTNPNMKDGSLVRWAEQGVLLLNTCLTVEEGAPASHAKLGWEGLTDALINLVAERNKNVVFMLWGAHAQAKQVLLKTPKSLANKHLVLCANHPSPLSALRPPVPFIGCGHFGLANAFLIKQGMPSINW